MRVPGLLAAALLVAPLPGQAVELLLGWDARGSWESNVFRSANDEESDFSLYTGPNIRVRQPQGDLRFDVEYRPRYEAFVQFNEANDFDQFLTARGNWSLTRRTELYFFDRFARTQSLRQVVDQDSVDPTQAGDVFADREPILRNFATVGGNHWLEKRTQLGVDFSQQIYRFDDSNRANSTTFRASSTVRHLLTPRQTIGLGVGASRQNFDLEPERQTDVIETFGIYQATLSPAWSFSLTGGPAWLFPDDGGEEFLVLEGGSLETAGGDEDTSLTFYGVGSIRYVRSPYTFDLSYTRRASASTGAGATTNLDTVGMLAAWNPDRRWRFSVRATWQKQTSAYDQFQFAGLLQTVPPTPVYQRVSDAIDVTSYRLTFRASHALTRRLQLVALTSWWYQDSKGGLEVGRSGALEPEPDETRQDLRFEIGFSWEFDPIPL